MLTFGTGLTHFLLRKCVFRCSEINTIELILQPINLWPISILSDQLRAHCTVELNVCSGLPINLTISNFAAIQLHFQTPVLGIYSNFPLLSCFLLLTFAEEILAECKG